MSEIGNYYIIYDRDGVRALTRWSPSGVATINSGADDSAIVEETVNQT
jgi:hypothetical protein